MDVAEHTILLGQRQGTVYYSSNASGMIVMFTSAALAYHFLEGQMERGQVDAGHTVSLYYRKWSLGNLNLLQ